MVFHPINEKIRIIGYRVGTSIKYENTMRVEYYVDFKNLRSFGKNPKIFKLESSAQEFLNKVKKSTGNEDLFIDPIYVASEI